MWIRTLAAKRRGALRSIPASILAAVLLLLGCTSSDPTPPPPGAESSASPVPTWDLVLMGDSVWLQPGTKLELRLEEELGVELLMHDWINPDAGYTGGGERSGDLLDRLRTDENLRRDLQEAEIIGFDVPMGLLKDVCTEDPRTATPAEVETCFDVALQQYQDDVTAIFEEIVALRDPGDAIIRATTVWQLLMPTFQTAGTYDVVRPRWQAMNQATLRAAEQHNITTLPAYDTFCGPDGSRDPVAAGDVGADEFHLTPQGVERFIDLFVASGLEAADAP